MSIKKNIAQVCEEVQISQEMVIHFIEEKWIIPSSDDELDEEDAARIQLLRELKLEFEVNDEGIPIILHLIDQLNLLRLRLQSDWHT